MKKISFNSSVFYIVLTFFLSLSNLMYSADIHSETQCPNLAAGTTFSVVDPELGSTNYVSISDKVSLELSINDFIGPFYWYTATVTINIQPILSNGSLGTSYTTSLEIQNNRYGGFGNFVDLQRHILQDPLARGANITVVSVIVYNNDSLQNESIAPSNLKLIAKFDSTRFYNLVTTVSPTVGVSLNSTTNSIDFSWNTIVGAEEYELEWTWVDNYGTTSTTPLTPSQISFRLRDFAVNNSRIQTKQNTYSISNIYDRGYLLYRIRAIGRYNSIPSGSTLTLNDVVKSNLYTVWSGNQNPQFVSDWDNILLSGHQSNLNWQFQSSFAENGKKKEVVSYFDGSLRNRQTVTKINTNQKAIVGEVIYDNEGRPAIEVLPAPVNSNSIKYYPNFNNNINGKVYSYQDFLPLDEGLCDFNSLGMSPDSGSSKYYSDNSSHEDTFQDFVPKSNTFPFSQTLYSNDNTGRIKSKGGVGDQHQIGSSHEMKYFYSVPAQEELNRLFGYHVGNALHYKKNIVIDPNGQLSVSYLDPQGRTIATALAAESPDSMESLNDPDGVRAAFTEDLLNKLNSNDFDTDIDNNIKYKSGMFGNLFDGLRYDSQKVLTSAGTDYTFNYSLINNSLFSFGCDNPESTFQISYPFVYKLKIDIQNDCGISQLENQQPIESTFGSYETDGNGVVTSTNNPGTISHNIVISPQVGNYGVTKKLEVDPVALEVFAEDYLKKAMDSDCIFGIQAPSANDTGCYTSCDDCKNHYLSLSYTNGSVQYTGQAAYVQELIDSNYDLSQLTPGTSAYNDLLNLLTQRYTREFQLIVAACMQPCDGTGVGDSTSPPTSSIACSGMLSQINADVMPGGQYANGQSIVSNGGNVNTNPTDINVDTLPLSVFNETNTNKILAIVAGLPAPVTTAGTLNQNNWRHPNYYNKDNFNIGSASGVLNHYYNENGLIDYVSLEDLGDGTFSPEILASATSDVIHDSEGNSKIEPQYLKNLTDFISLYQSHQSWALSLVKYHPEFHYINYLLKYCDPGYTKNISFNLDNQPGNENYNVNSDGFDALLSRADTFDKAVAAGLLNSDSTLLDNDPFFQNVHPLDGYTTSVSGVTISEVASTTALRESYRQTKLSIMKQALMKNSGTPNSYLGYSLGIGEPNVTMFRSIYEIIRCTGIGGNCNELLNSSFTEIMSKVNSNLDQEEKDRFWRSYLSGYLGLKQKIKDVFINLHAARNGAYNDCIGNPNGPDLNHITSGISERYGQETNFVSSQLATIITPNNCSYNGAELAIKTKRFIMQEDAATGSTNTSTAQANSTYYSQTGICPMVRDLEMFFDISSRKASFAPIYRGTTPINPPSVNFITPALLTEMGGSYSTAGSFVSSGNITNGNKTITLNFTQNGLSLKSIELTIPNTSNNTNLNWNTYSNPGFWKIVKMSNLTYTTFDGTSGKYNFKVLAKITINGNDYFERVFEGRTSITLTCTSGASLGANNGNPILLEPLESSDCDKKQLFADGLKSLMQSLVSSNHIFSLTPYTVTLPTYLRTYFGVSGVAYTARWQVLETGPTPSIAKKFMLSVVKSGTNINTGIIIYRNNQTTSYALPATPVNNIVIGNTDDIENVHTIKIKWENNFFNGFIHRVSNNQPNKVKMYFTCCSSCGREYDYDADGVGDDDLFNADGCDFCDNRIDANNDGLSDCPTCNSSGDFDCDGIINSSDNCPLIENAGQENSDGDAFGDACDFCPELSSTTNEDTDGDGIGNLCDNCPLVFNSDQSNYDGDQYGDACDPGCFVDGDKALFEDRFATLLNAIVTTSTSMNVNTGNANSMPAHISFYTDYDMENRAANNLNQDVNPTCGYSGVNGGFSADQNGTFGLNNVIFSYQKGGVNNFPTKLRWRKSPTSVYTSTNYDYYQFELNNLSQPIPGPVTQINSVTLIEPTATNQHGIMITGMYINFDLEEVEFTVSAQLLIKLKKTGSIVLCTYENSLCQFLPFCYLCKEANTSNKQTNYNASINRVETTQYTCPCIPKPVVPVACDEAYADYMQFMSNTFGASNEEATYYANRMDYFCGQNLSYLVAGYKDYITHLGITSTSHPRYITIATFGATGLNFGYDNYLTVIVAYVTYLNNNVNAEQVQNWKEFVSVYLAEHPSVCPPAPMYPTQSIVIPFPENTACQEFNLNVAEVYNSDNYALYLAAKKEAFKKEYLKQALETANENFTLSYSDKEYQYTLYYYDQAGNLIQTVAPQGVAVLPVTDNDAIDDVRINNPNYDASTLIPNHNFKTQYRYNSLNQLVWQSTPDGGQTRFAYDLLGRIVASQNSKQLNSNIIIPSLSLAPYLKTDDDKIFNVGKNVDVKNSYGYSTETISENGYAEYTVRIENNSFVTTNNVIFGLDHDNSGDGNVDYGFYHDESGNFVIKGIDCENSATYSVSEGDKLKIERDNEQIRFYQNDQLLVQCQDKLYQKPLYVGFFLTKENSQINELRIAIVKGPRDFSYTCYDNLGRIKEAGQFKANKNIRIDDNGKLIYSNLSWVGVSSVTDNYPHNVSEEQKEVTKTLYDNYGPFNPDNYLSPQSKRNVRNRVTTILSFDVANATTPLENNETAIFYNYDIHGNVDEMVQRTSPIILYVPGEPNGVLKRVNYEYDLISGNVNKVIYQKGNKYDQFIHRYNYDADNRITFVETSKEGLIWEKDASYEYYEHGPLARVITGDKKVQGTDYAYTLQGWLKTVNSENLATNVKDMGHDGDYVSKDAYGYSLSYFNHDYEARQPGTNDAHFVSNSGTVSQGGNLYNGNINRMITSLRGLDEQIMPTQINLYSYDQLNRIFAMNSFKGTETANVFNPSQSYQSNYTYDKNGNLQTLNNTAPTTSYSTQEVYPDMDKFTYHYTPFTNRLTHINDEVPADVFDVDIDNQEDANNYKYDAIGQLISDKAENITNIVWRVDGKVKSVEKYGGGMYINFFYDGLGNRIAKQVTRGRAGTTTTHYSLDAQGNVLAVYNLKLNQERKPEYILKEHHIYGSSRIGLQEYEPYTSHLAAGTIERLVGDKRYELTNHLGNVLSVINDRKITNSSVLLILADTFEELAWQGLNDANVDLNKERELIVETKAGNSNCGAYRNLKFEDGKTVMFNLEINKGEDFPTDVPLTFEVRNRNTKEVLWSTLVSQNGVVSGSFTPSETNEFMVSITADCSQSERVAFNVDNFYAYTLPQTPSDFSSLFLPDVLAYNDYYPFGMLVPNRHAATNDYRYGFQNQEKDDEIKGEGNSLNYTFRMHDPRVGRFFAVDPLSAKYPYYSPYQFSGNRVIDMVELEGLEPAEAPTNEGKRVDAVDQNAVKTNDYAFSDLIGWITGNTQDNKLYKTWVSHLNTETNSYEWLEEANYKQIIMPIAIDYAKSEGWSFGTDWKSAKDLICNHGEPNGMISRETMNFLCSRNLAGDYTDYLTQIGAHEINSANKAMYGSATGAITPMELDDPFIGLAFGLRGFATGSKSVSGATFGVSTTNNYRKTFFNAYPELEGQVVVHHAVEQQVLTRYNIVTETEIHSLENLRGIPTELNNSLHLSDIRKEWNRFYKANPSPTKQMLLDKATEIDIKFGDQFLPKK